jgi:hypothetical protein
MQVMEDKRHQDLRQVQGCAILGIVSHSRWSTVANSIFLWNPAHGFRVLCRSKSFKIAIFDEQSREYNPLLGPSPKFGFDFTPSERPGGIKHIMMWLLPFLPDTKPRDPWNYAHPQPPKPPPCIVSGTAFWLDIETLQFGWSLGTTVQYKMPVQVFTAGWCCLFFNNFLQQLWQIIAIQFIGVAFDE